MRSHWTRHRRRDGRHAVDRQGGPRAPLSPQDTHGASERPENAAPRKQIRGHPRQAHRQRASGHARAGPERGGNLLLGAGLSRHPRGTQPDGRGRPGPRRLGPRPHGGLPLGAGRDRWDARHDTDVTRGRLPRGRDRPPWRPSPTRAARAAEPHRAGRSEPRAPTATHARDTGLAAAAHFHGEDVVRASELAHGCAVGEGKRSATDTWRVATSLHREPPARCAESRSPPPPRRGERLRQAGPGTRCQQGPRTGVRVRKAAAQLPSSCLLPTWLDAPPCGLRCPRPHGTWEAGGWDPEDTDLLQGSEGQGRGEDSAPRCRLDTPASVVPGKVGSANEPWGRGEDTRGGVPGRPGPSVPETSYCP